jgi:hypothetical protein
MRRVGSAGWVTFRGIRQGGTVRTSHTIRGNRPWSAHLLEAHEVRSHPKLRRTHG